MKGNRTVLLAVTVGLLASGCQTTESESLGDATFSQGLHNEAIEHYDTELRDQPASAKTYTNRGNVFSVRGHHERAIDHYNAAIQLDPKFGPAYARRGDAYYSRGLYEKAILDYEKAIDLKAAGVSVYNNRENAKLRLREAALSQTNHPVRNVPAEMARAEPVAPAVIPSPNRIAITASPSVVPPADDRSMNMWQRPKRVVASVKPTNPIEAVKFADERVAGVERTGDVMAITIDIGEFQSSPHYVKSLASALVKVLPVARDRASDAKEYRIFGIATLEYPDGKRTRGPVMSFTLPREKIQEMDFSHMASNRVLDYANLEVSTVGRKLIVGYCTDDNWLLELLQASAAQLEVLTDMYRWFLPGYSSEFCLVTFPKAPVRAEAVLPDGSGAVQPKSEGDGAK